MRPPQKLRLGLLRASAHGVPQGEASTDEEPGFIYVPEAPSAQRRVLMPEHGAGPAAPSGAEEEMVMARAGMLGVGDQEKEEEGIHIFPEAPGVMISDR